jgi:elongation factor G
VPRIAFINKMDRTGADFFASVQSMVDRLGARPVPVQLPIGQEEHFRGVVDLVEMRAVVWEDDLGTKMDVVEIPEELLEQAQEYHHQLIEAVADHDDELLETYLSTRTRSRRDAEARPARRDARHHGHAGARRLSVQEQGRPGRCSTASSTTCRARSTCRRSRDRPAHRARALAPARRSTSRSPRSSSRSCPTRTSGKLTYFRVYSGQVKAGDRRLNTATGKTERIGRILQMHANHREEREDIGAGEIAAAVGLKASTTGDTLAIDTAPIRLESMDFPEPVIAVAIEPKTKADQDKLASGLQRLSEEDPTFRVRTTTRPARR